MAAEVVAQGDKQPDALLRSSPSRPLEQWCVRRLLPAVQNPTCRCNACRIWVPLSSPAPGARRPRQAHQPAPRREHPTADPNAELDEMPICRRCHAERRRARPAGHASDCALVVFAVVEQRCAGHTVERDVDSVEPRWASTIAKIHVVDYALLRPDGRPCDSTTAWFRAAERGMQAEHERSTVEGGASKSEAVR